jgi:hypothetical protein
LELGDLALTPAQLAEVRAVDNQLVREWLDACGRRAGLRSPAGWFLSGVRSGNRPDSVPDEAGKAQAVRLAERRIANLGHRLPSEAELLEEIFGKRALLEAWAHDVELRARMVETWKRQARAPIAWPRR